MLEFFQAEWCPYSHRVRERMTELGIDFIARQVQPRLSLRDDLEQEIGTRSIPALKTEDGRVIEGDVAIMAFLAENYGKGEEWEHGHQAMELRHPTLRQGASRDPA